MWLLIAVGLLGILIGMRIQKWRDNKLINDACYYAETFRQQRNELVYRSPRERQ
jgi:xanthosine utilization system XapX-like protein